MKKTNVISLTHWINETTPSYGNQGGFTRYSISAIKEGRTANSEEWTLNNHLGTHIDFPKHFNDNGATASDYINSFFIYKNIGFIELDCPAEPGMLIQAKDIELKIKALPKSTEILLLKSFFENYRNQDIYWKNNPGYHEDLSILFRDHFDNLKAFGFDSISLTSFEHREMGKKSHQAFLNNKHPILIIEDMSLLSINTKMSLDELIISFFPVEKSDGSPVNCILNYKTYD